MVELTVSGKGVYIWRPKHIFGGDIDPIVEALVDARVSFVAIKIHDGMYIYPDLVELIRRIRAEGIIVGAWGYVYVCWDPRGEARKAAEAIRLHNPDFYLLDAEHHAKGYAAKAKLFAEEFKAQGITIPVGLNTYRYPHYHATFPFEELRAVCNFDCPQVYYRNGDPVANINSTIKAYDDYFKRKLPMSMLAGDMYFEHNIKPTPEAVTRFLQTCKESDEIQGVVMWAMDQIEVVPELWEAFSRFDWGGEAQQPPKPPEKDLAEDLLAFAQLVSSETTDNIEKYRGIYAEARKAGRLPVLSGPVHEQAVIWKVRDLLEKEGIGSSNEPQPAWQGTIKVSAGANVRTAPWGKVIKVLPFLARVSVYGSRGEWLHIDPQGTEWVHSSLVRKVS